MYGAEKATVENVRASDGPSLVIPGGTIKTRKGRNDHGNMVEVQSENLKAR